MIFSYNLISYIIKLTFKYSQANICDESFLRSLKFPFFFFFNLILIFIDEIFYKYYYFLIYMFIAMKPVFLRSQQCHSHNTEFGKSFIQNLTCYYLKLASMS